MSTISVDEVQTGFCIVESNCVTIVTDSGSEHHVTLPFHIVHAWPLEKGILFQRTLEKSSGGDNSRYVGYNTNIGNAEYCFSRCLLLHCAVIL